MSAAAIQFQKALSLQPGLLPALNYPAIIEAAKGKYDSAIEMFKKVIDEKPDLVEQYYYIAAIQSRQNHIDQSIEWLKRAMAMGYKNWDNLRQDANFKNIR